MIFRAAIVALFFIFEKKIGDNEMKDVEKSIEFDGKKYTIVFNLNVMEEIQNEFGTLSAWGELSDGTSTGEPDARAVIFGFTAMLNEGIDIDNEKRAEKVDFLTPKQVGRMMSELGLDNVAKVLNDAVIASTQSTEKNE